MPSGDSPTPPPQVRPPKVWRHPGVRRMWEALVDAAVRADSLLMAASEAGRHADRLLRALAHGEYEQPLDSHEFPITDKQVRAERERRRELLAWGDDTESEKELDTRQRPQNPNLPKWWGYRRLDTYWNSRKECIDATQAGLHVVHEVAEELDTPGVPPANAESALILNALNDLNNEVTGMTRHPYYFLSDHNTYLQGVRSRAGPVDVWARKLWAAAHMEKRSTHGDGRVTDNRPTGQPQSTHESPEGVLAFLAESEHKSIASLPTELSTDILRELDVAGHIEVRFLTVIRHTKPHSISPSPWFSPIKNPSMSGDWDAIRSQALRPNAENVFEVRVNDRGRAELSKLRRAALRSDAPSANMQPNTGPQTDTPQGKSDGEGPDDYTGPRLKANEARVLKAMARFDPSQLLSNETIATETGDKQAKPPLPPLSERTVGPIVQELIRLTLAERPKGDRSGSTLNGRGRRLASKIAD